MESVLDLETLLAPIAGPNPSGRSLAYEPEYDALKEARRADDGELQGEWERETKSAEWDLVVTLATECLKEKSKDLQIAAWLTEALAQLHGFAGIREGFTLLRELVGRFWDTLYPEIEDGDLGWRAAPLEFLGSDKILPVLIRSIPLTNVMGEKRYSLVRYQESRATDNLARKDPNAVAALLADGKITGEQFDEAVAQTPRRYVEALHADLVSAQEAFKALDALLDERFGRAAPSLSGVRKAFEDVRRVLDPILKKKREQEPDREPESETEIEEGRKSSSKRSTRPRPRRRRWRSRSRQRRRGGRNQNRAVRPGRSPARRKPSNRFSRRRPTSASMSRPVRSPTWSSGP